MNYLKNKNTYDGNTLPFSYLGKCHSFFAIYCRKIALRD
jgi:hypothetical protein